MESLIRHESTHVLAARTLGSASCTLWGEGLAVWVAGGYGGKRLEQYAELKLPRGVGLRELLGPGFTKLPEQVSYPIAGRLVAALIEAHGLESFQSEFYRVAPSEIDTACERVGTSVAELEAPLLKSSAP
jgi:hypothetical protein